MEEQSRKYSHYCERCEKDVRPIVTGHIVEFSKDGRQVLVRVYAICPDDGCELLLSTDEAWMQL